MRGAPVPRKTGKSVIAFRLNTNARHVIELARQAHVDAWRIGDAILNYHLRRRLDERMSSLAERIASKPLTSHDDLLTLALAAWYAPGARHTLVTTILRAGRINPKALGNKLRPQR